MSNGIDKEDIDKIAKSMISDPTEYKTRYKIEITSKINALAMLLISKEIITLDEYKEATEVSRAIITQIHDQVNETIKDKIK